ncbi:TonB-dependent receptor, partial [bacterium]
QLYNTHQKNKGVQITGSIGAELKIFKDLKFNSNLGVTASWIKGYTFNDLSENWLTLNPFSSLQDYRETFGSKTVLYNSLEQRKSEDYNWNWDNYLTYQKEFGRHNLTIVAGMSRTTSNNSEFLNGFRYNVPAESNYWKLNFSNNFEGTNPNVTVQNVHETPRISLAYFGRIEYEFNNKYLLSATVRREGLSVFQGEKKWGVFPAVSAGWVLSNENFLKDVDFLDNLKVRGGYGEVGNGNGPSLNIVSFTGNKNYSFGVANIINPGSYVANAVDPNLTWETMKEFDFGIDFGVMENRLTGSLDFYNRKSVDVILSLDLPPVLSEEQVYLNSGEVTNKGFEAALRWQDDINDNLNYWIGANFSKNENEVTKADNPYFNNQASSGSLGNGEWTKAVYEG